ncbi:putative SP-containing protein [Vairimorpha necatrix]|uniref:SP-containing protein n=1 Tax=Vairimorpha necatrix TaxID=6039 RepID=A0AAX4JAH6_9MICR
MYFLLYLILHVCSDFNIRNPRTNEKIYYSSSLIQKLNFDDIPEKVCQELYLDHYHKIVKDFFLILRGNLEIRKRTDSLVSNKDKSNKSGILRLLIVVFKQYLNEFSSGKSYDAKCSHPLSFLESLAYHSYNLIFKLSNVETFNIYKKNINIINDQIIKSLDVKLDKDCEKTIVQLFNPEGYKKLLILLNNLYTDDHYLLDLSNISLSHTKTIKPSVQEQVTPESIGKRPCGTSFCWLIKNK